MHKYLYYGMVNTQERVTTTEEATSVPSAQFLQFESYVGQVASIECQVVTNYQISAEHTEKDKKNLFIRRNRLQGAE
jgi:hypothetical protein